MEKKAQIEKGIEKDSDEKANIGQDVKNEGKVKKSSRCKRVMILSVILCVVVTTTAISVALLTRQGKKMKDANKYYQFCIFMNFLKHLDTFHLSYSH